MSETQLISLIKQKCEQVPAPKFDITIGDDCAVRKEISGGRLVLSSDISIEGVHFSRNYMTLSEIGYKSAITNISDIAAMGATPDFMIVNLAFPKSLSASEVIDIYDGIISAAKKYCVPVVGGDLSAGSNIIISITIGGISKERVLTRNGAKIGDNIWVSGNPGNSAIGLELLQKHGRKKAEKLNKDAVLAHIKPEARVNLGKYLKNCKFVNSCIDISDGVAKEIREICSKSNVGAIIPHSALPASPLACGSLLRFLTPHFFNGGEDYELLFTADKEFIPEFDDIKFTQIGEITADKDIVEVIDGIKKPFNFFGFEHF